MTAELRNMAIELAKAIAVAVLPDRAIQALRRRLSAGRVFVMEEDGSVRQLPDWEAVPVEQGWNQTKGWAHESIVERQNAKWDRFVESATSPSPLARSHEADVDSPFDPTAQITVFSFGYVLGRALADARGGDVSVLDWGGGLGHYHVYARQLFPDAPIDWYLKDMPDLCRAGAERNPRARFIDNDEQALARRYDLVFASSSLHYERDVYALTRRLAAAASRYLFVTRTPFVEKVDDFVVMQRPHRYGYFTEYAGWFLNRPRFVAFVAEQGFVLDREILLTERPFVENAPEQCHYRGLLFRRTRQ